MAELIYNVKNLVYGDDTIMIKLIASDLDGTMFEKGNTIPETNLKAMQDINNSNINFTICTGKTYSLFKNTVYVFRLQAIAKKIRRH